MIVTFEQLSEYRGRVAMVDGVFDPLHHGHIEYFRGARALGLPVLCNVSPDDYLQTKHPPLLAIDQRSRVIDALEDVAYTHPSRRDTAAVLAALQPRYYVKGADWRDRLPPREIETCSAQGTEIVYLDTVLASSTRLLEALAARTFPAARLAGLEDLVAGQQPVPADTYDSAYYTHEWRENAESYSIESRRHIEGEHPRLIRSVFQPRRVLDMGCGPGALMYLLHELGVDADGVDISPACRALAPEAVRDRIRIGSITEPQVAARSYDLVICREVIEHLTLLQARRVVQQMCRASSRFVYATTRFHPDPRDLLDVTSEPEVDPTHITLMHKDLLRLMLVLEGFHRREDLESRMDWLNKGRVLVYERIRENVPAPRA